MLLNETTTLWSSRLVLRPYRKWHVEQYHAWMEDETIREQTASERLTMEEEQEMQRSWRLDEDKLTFIVHLRDPSAPCPESDPKGFLQAHNDATTMIGDVNLFLHSSTPDEDDDEECPNGASPSPRTRTAELEIMLPTPTSPNPLYKPRTGLGLETLQTFLSYASKHLELGPNQFIAKVGFDNEPSLKLFEKLGFVQVKRVEVFREVELGWKGKGESHGEHMWSWEEEGQGWETGILEDPRDPERD